MGRQPTQVGWRPHTMDPHRPRGGCRCERRGPGTAGRADGTACRPRRRKLRTSSVTAWLVLLDYGYPAVIVVRIQVAGSLVLRLAMRSVAEGFVFRKATATDEYWEFGPFWNFVGQVSLVFNQPRHKFSLHAAKQDASHAVFC